MAQIEINITLIFETREQRFIREWTHHEEYVELGVRDRDDPCPNPPKEEEKNDIVLTYMFKVGDSVEWWV